FVSTATSRRGTAAAPPPWHLGSMHSSSGNAMATPAPRRNVRRDNAARPTEKDALTGTPLSGIFRRETSRVRCARVKLAQPALRPAVLHDCAAIVAGTIAGMPPENGASSEAAQPPL